MLMHGNLTTSTENCADDNFPTMEQIKDGGNAKLHGANVQYFSWALLSQDCGTQPIVENLSSHCPATVEAISFLALENHCDAWKGEAMKDAKEDIHFPTHTKSGQGHGKKCGEWREDNIAQFNTIATNIETKENWKVGMNCWNNY